jgi:quercetin dioxygenase-like cupin family protein
MVSNDPVRSPRLRQQVRFLDEAGRDGDEVLRIKVIQDPGRIVPPHVHPAQEERFHVVAGEISLRIGRQRLHLGVGDSATVPPGTAHSFRVRGAKAAQLMNEFRPPLDTKDCFVETFELDSSADPVLSKLVGLTRIARKYPREFLFYAPGIPWEGQRQLLDRVGGALGRFTSNGDDAPERSQHDGLRASRGLAIYMNDQLAAGILWREVARRAARENQGNDGAEALSQVAGEIAEDVELFRGIMRRLRIPERRLKTAAAVVAERFGRLKLNGQLFGYQPLSKFVELDLLVMGIEGKKILWSNLGDLARLRQHLEDISFDELVARAERQRALIEPIRHRAGEAAFEVIAAPTA